MSDETPVSKLEQRWVGLLTAISLAFGGWWLQNQYQTTLKIQDSITQLIRDIDSRYVDKDVGRLLDDRLGRIERKIDQLGNQTPRP
jgi:hypothetical protein